MNALIMAGGFATRLRPLTLTRPKALLPILDKPLIDWLISDLVDSGLKNITLVLYHMYDKIVDHVSNSWRGLSSLINYHVESLPLGDAGSIREIAMGNGVSFPILITYGDIFSKINYRQVMDYHKKMGGIATIVATVVEDVSRFGVLKFGDDNRLIRLIEKPKTAGKESGYVNAGVYVVEEEIIDLIEPGKKQNMARDIIPKAIDRGDIYVYRYNGVWNDIGTPSDYLEANIQAIYQISSEGVVISSNAEIDKDVEVKEPIYIGSGVNISSHSSIGPYTVIMSGTSVGLGALIENSLLMPNTRISNHTVVRESIIGFRSYIGSWSRISKGTIIGDGVVIGDKSCIGEGTIVLPFKEIYDDLCSKTGRIIL